MRDSNYQSELYTQGVRFCSVINKGQSPPSTASSADYLVDFYEGSLGTRRSRKDVEEGTMKSGATKSKKKVQKMLERKGVSYKKEDQLSEEESKKESSNSK